MKFTLGRKLGTDLTLSDLRSGFDAVYLGFDSRKSHPLEIPGADGYLGVLPGHTPLLTTLQVGTLWYRQGQDKHYLVIAFGFAEVQPDRVTIRFQRDASRRVIGFVVQCGRIRDISFARLPPRR